MRMTSFRVGVAAEALTASLFARVGCDISVQYGANQPEYDLVVVKGDQLIKVSVKGSQDGSWGLTQTLLKNADYHGAIATWLARHGTRTVFSLVQFKNVGLDETPRVYLATPGEIATRLRDTARGRGDTILYERHKWSPRARGAGITEEIPQAWRFSTERVAKMFEAA